MYLLDSQLFDSTLEMTKLKIKGENKMYGSLHIPQNHNRIVKHILQDTRQHFIRHKHK